MAQTRSGETQQPSRDFNLVFHAEFSITYHNLGVDNALFSLTGPLVIADEVLILKETKPETILRAEKKHVTTKY